MPPRDHRLLHYVNLTNNDGSTVMRDEEYGPLSVFNQVMKTCSDFPTDSYGKVV